MASFANPVAIPPTSAYGPQSVDFGILGDLYNTYQNSERNKLAIDQQREQLAQQQKLRTLFQGGLPTDANGNLDYQAITQALAKAGDTSAVGELYPAVQVQQAGGLDPYAGLPGHQPGQQPQAGQPQAPASQGPRSSNAPIGDLPPTAGAASGQTVQDIVGAQFPADSDTRRTLITNIAKSVGTQADAPLQPQQADAVKRRLAAYAQRNPPQQTAQAAPQPEGTNLAGPAEPLPPGFKPDQWQAAVEWLRNRAAKISDTYGPRASGAVRELERKANAIEASHKPIQIGGSIVSPEGKVLYRAPGTNAANVALQRFLSENPDASAQDIQAFVQSGRAGRSAIAMYMNRYLQEHPDATADDVKRAAQQYTTQTTAQNRFLSGPQGNTIRSLNVVVSHLQTMQDLGDALKNGDIRVFNQVAQRWSEETGDPAPTNFDTAKQIVGAEVIKALGVAGAGTQSERQEAADAFSRARSPEQLRGAINVARKLMLGQLGGLRQQFIAATGLKGNDFDAMLQPETRAFFGTELAGEGGKTESGKAPVGKPDAQGWITLPNGVKIRPKAQSTPSPNMQSS